VLFLFPGFIIRQLFIYHYCFIQQLPEYVMVYLFHMVKGFYIHFLAIADVQIAGVRKQIPFAKSQINAVSLGSAPLNG
jgi:hypothetical protein